jgi:carbon storage regulator CsrA
MLVLSRRINEKLVFPDIGAAVQVVSVRGNSVRLGIQAPQEVTVLRGEIPAFRAEGADAAQATGPAEQTIRHPLARLVGRRLQVAGSGLDLLRGHLKAGRAEDAQALAEQLAEDLQLLQRRLVTEPGGNPQPPLSLSCKGRRALLVEDNANERELLARFLRLGGFEVDTAGDGADALDYLRGRGRPDVVLLDMGLPRCDGPTTVREIRRDGGLADLKIVAVSGHRPEEYGLLPGPGSVDRWFSKPVDPDALVRDLQGVLSCS